MWNYQAVCKLKQHLPREFEDDRLLLRALTHSSYLNENHDTLEDNERLEFLGDAILGFVVAKRLYQAFPEAREGELTQARSVLVNQTQLADIARGIGLGPCLLLGKGEEAGGGRDKDAILCDAFEALIAALYLGTKIDLVEDFLLSLLNPQIAMNANRHNIMDDKSQLQEWAQAQNKNAPVYVSVSETGPDHAKVFTVQVKIDGDLYSLGTGTSKQAAEKNAAKNTLVMVNAKK